MNMLREIPDAALAMVDRPDIDLEVLMGQAREGIVYVDENLIVRYCNDVYLQGVGLKRHEVIGKSPYEFQPHFKRSIFHDTLDSGWRERRPKAAIGFSTVLDRWLLVRVFPVGKGMMMLANDASESVIEQYQLAQQALKDTLTGLPNRLAMLQALHPHLASGETVCLAVLGLNRFRSVNDAVGYARGDLALLEIASRLQSATHAGEQLFRLSGDEFAFITPVAQPLAEARIRSLLAQARRPVVIHGQVFVLGAAAGAVSAPGQGTDAESLLQRAGLALRHAKRHCSDEVLVYEPALETASRLRLELEGELRQAIQQGQLMLMLQPKGCLLRHHVIGAEALIRWPHPTRGLVAPGDFLILAQECGLMPQIDGWVLWQALEQVKELMRRGLAMPISINLSVESLSDVGLVDRVRQSLEATGVPASLLEIEIPEGALMRDVQTSASVLAELDALGVGISIDDFGTGYSSFAYLARFPVRTLKVDRSFVSEMTTNEASRTIVKGLIRLAHSLSLRVVAEGAETAEQMALLRRMRCDEVQGFGYARPMPFEDFCEFARKNGQPVGPSAFTI